MSGNYRSSVVGVRGPNSKLSMFAACFTAAMTLVSAPVMAEMSVGANLWRIDWGNSNASQGSNQPQYNYFAANVNWATTTDPWNPTFLSELNEAKIKCLRFMDWGPVNGSSVTSWSGRKSKTESHYTGASVAYEWMIDLCNRINADMWVCVPHQANTDYAFQLATLIKNNLNPNLKVYVEYSNECWNDGFSQTGWLDAQRNINGLANPLQWQGHSVYGFGNGGDCRWSEYVYFVCRTMNQFNTVFGTNSPRVVKVLAGQAGWGGGTGSNQMCEYHMAALQSPICNPWGVKIDAYAIAPYWNASDHAPTGTEASMRASLADCVSFLQNTQNALTGSGVPLICYEGGPDNFSTESIANNSFQYQLTIDALTAFAGRVQGIFNWYTLIGGCWGFKVQTGDDPAISPKWRGLMQWLGQPTSGTIARVTADKTSGTMPLTVAFDGSASTGTNLTYAWQFGDGQTGSGAKVAHTFQTAGAFKTVLTVSGDVNKDSAQTVITVIDPGSALRIAKVSTAPTIDGVEDALWQNATAQSTTHAILGTPASQADFSGQFKTMWDNDNLYVILKVTDNISSTSASVTYQNDGVEVYVDGDNSKGSSYDANDVQYRIVRGKSALEASGSGHAANVTVAQHEDAGGYVVEFKFTWASIGSVSAAAKLIGLEVHVTDNDGTAERKAILAWAGTADDAWGNPAAFGTAQLSDAATAAIPVAGSRRTAFSRWTDADHGAVELIDVRGCKVSGGSGVSPQPRGVYLMKSSDGKGAVAYRRMVLGSSRGGK